MVLRKLEEAGSGLYRALIFPFLRMAVELRTKSVCKQRSYFNGGTVLRGRNYLGRNVYLSHVEMGFGSYISDRGILKNTAVGKYTSIGADVKAVLGRHPVKDFAAMHPAFYSSQAAMGYTYSRSDEFEEQSYLDAKRKIQIRIGSDVWIGSGVSILEGVTIGHGAVVGAGSLVAGDLAPYGVYAGVPARRIGSRFEEGLAGQLLEARWWDRDETWIREHVSLFRDAKKLAAYFRAEADGRQGDQMKKGPPAGESRRTQAKEDAEANMSARDKAGKGHEG